MMASAAIHGSFLTLVNIFAILAGFAIAIVTPAIKQLTIQLPVAVLFTLIIFLLGEKLVNRSPFLSFQLQSKQSWILAYLFSLVCTPFVFIPLHYLTQGYLTSFSNILAIWLFQLPVNFIAIFLAARWLKGKRHTDPNY
jgi:hypothetical protein